MKQSYPRQWPSGSQRWWYLRDRNQVSPLIGPALLQCKNFQGVAQRRRALIPGGLWSWRDWRVQRDQGWVPEKGSLEVCRGYVLSVWQNIHQHVHVRRLLQAGRKNCPEVMPVLPRLTTGLGRGPVLTNHTQNPHNLWDYWIEDSEVSWIYSGNY